MPAVKLTAFAGIAPKVPARYLQPTQAVVAENCAPLTGPLRPLEGFGAPVATAAAESSGTRTIYRYGQDIISDSQYWFDWGKDVDVCRSQIAGDTSEWTIFTGDGTPKATYAALALSGSTYPSESRPLGLRAPQTAATASVQGTADETDTPETRVYTWTWVSKEAGLEQESAPAPASNAVDTTISQTVALSGLEPPPAGGYVMTHRRIYRSVSGQYLFVAEIDAAATSYTDDVASDALGENIPSLLWSEPPAGLTGATNMANGMVAGFVGRDVLFCEPYRPYAWPDSYTQTVDYPVVALGRLDTTLVVLTTGVPYFMQGSHPDMIAVVKSDVEQACVAKRSVVAVGGGVVYAAPDGLVYISPGGSKILTAGLFDREQWQAYSPQSIHAYRHDNQYIAFYNTGSKVGGFVFDFNTGQFSTNTLYAVGGYNDLITDKLYLAQQDGSIVVWRAGAVEPYKWTSKVFSTPATTGFSCGRVLAESYPVKFTLTANGQEILSKNIQDRSVFRLPDEVGVDWQITLEGSSEVYTAAVATSPMELANE